MPILSMPATPGIKRTRFLLQANTQVFVSPLSQAVQTLERVGARWGASFELPPMVRADAEEWCAFLARLLGRAGRFYAGDSAGTTPRGVATGTPLVKNGGQTGSSLTTDGWTVGITGILKTGDYVSWNTPTAWRELHKLTADATSDGSGNATLSITPPIRESPADNAPLIVQSATCVMMLASDDAAAWDVDEARIYGIQFSADEAFSETF